jgi:hypothetical protein
MLLDLSQTAQPLAQGDLQLGLIGTRKLRAQSIPHHAQPAFKQLDGRVDALSLGQSPSPPHLVGIDRISQGFDMSLVHKARLTASPRLFQHGFMRFHLDCL